jgi:N-acetylglucosaminyldiphosphoundecaprenol N-acetyl-beta-D-mannosaminyltransferase
MDSFIFLNIQIDNLNMSEVIDRVSAILKDKLKSYIVTPNASHIVMLQKDLDFREAYQHASLVLADGASLVLASKLLGCPLKERCTGADLFEKICKIAWENNKKVFILGGVNGSEKIAMKKLKRIYQGIQVLAYSPPFGFDKDSLKSGKIIDMINSFEADILFVCVGTPKSEKWIYRNLENLNIILACPFGAALDFFTGTKKRAPKWVQNIGCEWLWRLILEPKRLWRRYLIENAIFIWIVLKELFRKKFLK